MRKPIRMTIKWEELDEGVRATLDTGVAAIVRIDQRETFQDWMSVGIALKSIQIAAMHLANVSKPKGKTYNAAYAAISEHVPKLTSIHTTTKTHAMWMADNREAVERWHAGLNDVELQRKINHPSTVKRHYERQHQDPNAETEHKPSGLRDSVVQLQKELDELRAENAKLKRNREKITEGDRWTWEDSPKDIAAVMFELYPTKAGQLGSELMRLKNSTSSKPRSAKSRKGKGDAPTQELDLPASR